MNSLRLLTVIALLFGISGCNYKQSGSSAASASSTSVSIVYGAATQHSMAYNPNPYNVQVGTVVTWTNNDSINHTATSDTGVFDSGTLAAGQSYSYTFTATGTYTFHCNVHPSMTGTIIVQP